MAPVKSAAGLQLLSEAKQRGTSLPFNNMSVPTLLKGLLWSHNIRVVNPAMGNESFET